jgi:hypothetical protein
MVENLEVNGVTIRWMVEGFSLGQMEGATKENTSRTRNKVLERSFGPMADATSGHGTTGNSMEGEPLLLKTGNREMANGVKGREPNGLTSRMEQMEVVQQQALFNEN